MKNIHAIVTSAMTWAFTLSAATGMGIVTTKAFAAQKMEKCYGIAKAGRNDCQTKTTSCASSSTQNNQQDAFLFLPEGLCDRIVGGSLTSKNSTSPKK